MRAVRFRRKVDPGVLGHGSGRSEEPIAAVAAEPRGAAAPSHSRSYRRSLYNKTSLHRVCWKDNNRCDPCSSPTTPRSPLQEGWTNSRWWWWCRYEKRLPPDLENENAEQLSFDTYLLHHSFEGFQVDPDPLIWLTAAPRQETWLGVQACLVRPPLAFSTHARSVWEGW